jgi:hypothetical protein
MPSRIPSAEASAVPSGRTLRSRATASAWLSPWACCPSALQQITSAAAMPARTEWVTQASARPLRVPPALGATWWCGWLVQASATTTKQLVSSSAPSGANLRSQRRNAMSQALNPGRFPSAAHSGCAALRMAARTRPMLSAALPGSGWPASSQAITASRCAANQARSTRSGNRVVFKKCDRGRASSV